MKWLIRLYPKKWRQRYEDEFLDILENRDMSFRELIDVIINAMDARFLDLVEGMINMNKKIHDIMFDSIVARYLIIGSAMFIGLFGGYWISKSIPEFLEIQPKLLLIIGVGMGLFVGYIVGVARGILRVINVTKKEEVFLPTGKLKFEKSNN